MNNYITTIIIDDQPGCIDRLANDLVSFPEIKVVATANSVEKAKQIIPQKQPDLLFMDIEMPGSNGIDLLTELQPYVQPNMCIVFYSAHNKYVIQAFRNSAFDFLLKPYSVEELSVVINRVKQKMQTEQNTFNHLLEHLSVYDKGFMVPGPTGNLRMRGSQVLYLERVKRTWQLVSATPARTMYKLRSATTAEDILRLYPSFFKISQDTIINLDYLKSIEKGRCCILLPPFNDEFKVSQPVFAELREKILLI